MLEKKADIGNVTVLMDSLVGKYGVCAFNSQEGLGSWSTDIYEFEDKQVAESVFNLLLSVVVEMSPLVLGIQQQFFTEMGGN